MGMFLSKLSFSSQKVLRLLTSDHCSLCFHFKDDLDRYLKKNNLNVKVDYVDIRSDNTLFEKYKYEVPVLLINERFVLKHRFNRVQFEEVLRQLQGQTEE
uniref:Glutaredoxin-like protein n=1 Tax=Bursaphelenchus xylophilus TaxID=6326 RepID=A0A1I7SMW5_BURXY